MIVLPVSVKQANLTRQPLPSGILYIKPTLVSLASNTLIAPEVMPTDFIKSLGDNIYGN